MYDKAPFFLQNLMVSARGYQLNCHRRSSKFRQALAGYLQRDQWSQDQVIEYRENKRIEALARAADAPYYKNLFNDLGADWQDFIDRKAFETLPIVRRSDLQSNMDAFRRRPPQPTDKIETTSGTTGTSLSFPLSANVEPDQWAVWWRYRIRHGINIGHRCALFASFPIVPKKEDPRPYRVNFAGNEIRFSIFHISDETLPDYVRALNRYKPKWVHGNPTAIAMFCHHFLNRSAKLDYSIEHVTVGSENFLPWQRDVITEALGVSPRQHYGLAEAVANISECPDGLLRVDEDFSYTEFVPESDDGEICAIVGTPFSNEALGLLRYHTGDLARPASSEDEGGHWGRIVNQLDGRLTDYITLPGGRKVASLAGPFHATGNLAAAQIYQTKDGSLIVRYVPAKGWHDEKLSALEKRLRARVGHEISISFESREEIEKTSRGKAKLVVSDYSPA